MSVILPEEAMQDQTLEWINEILETDESVNFKHSLASEQSYQLRRYWEFLSQNMSHSYQSLVNLVSKKKKKRPSKKMTDNQDFLVYGVTGVEKDEKSDFINEWYKREYASQVGEPQEEDLDERLEKAANGLKWQSKCIAFDRLFYAPPIQHELTLEQVSWHDAPLALTCTCPAMVCMCSCRKNYLLPPGPIPRRLCPFWFGVKRFLWFFHCMKYPKPAGTLVPKLVAMVDQESAFYKSADGQKQLAEKGPEFCMSGCLQFLLSSSQANALLAAEMAKMQQIDLEGIEGLQQPTDTQSDVPDVMDTEGYCDAFSCTVATQTENDEATGELLMGEYTRVLYASAQNTFMLDADGKQLEISFYEEQPPDPCAFSFNRVLHVDEMKQQFSKVKKLYSSISVMIDKYSGKSKAELQCCHDSSSCRIRAQQNRTRKQKLRDAAKKAAKEEECAATWQKVEKAKSSIRKYLRYISLSDPCDKDYSKTEIRKCIPKPDGTTQDISNIDIKLNNIEKPLQIAGDASSNETFSSPSANLSRSALGNDKPGIDVEKSSDKLKFKVSFKDQKKSSTSDCAPCKW